MESVKKRSRWVAVAALATLTVVVLLASPWTASATTGNPTLTLTVTKGPNTGASPTRTIVGTGSYTDPELVCDTDGAIVNWDIRTGSFSGPIVDAGSTTTDANGNYTFTSIPLPRGEHYYVTASVTGTLSGGYGVGDVCPNATATAEIQNL
jgi:hypothetical protein